MIHMGNYFGSFYMFLAIRIVSFMGFFLKFYGILLLIFNYYYFLKFDIMDFDILIVIYSGFRVTADINFEILIKLILL